MDNGRKISRREFLGVTKTATIGGIIAAGIAGGAAGYLARMPEIKEVTKTVTITPPPAKLMPTKVGYVYVGPVGDYGWSYGHDRGRKWADERFKNIESSYIESVPEPEVTPAIESLVAKGCELIITTSFGFMDATAEAAEKYPDKYFVHISGYRSGAAGNASQNMSAAFAEFYQLYYLCGLAAGAVTQTGVIGYVGAYPIPEVVRHINAYVLGAQYAYKKRTGKNIKAHVTWLFSWVAPEQARLAASALIDEKNCDVLNYTEDTPAVLMVAEEYQKKNMKVWSFSHYSDMREYGPTAHLTGPVANWGPIYLDFYRMVATKTWQSVDIWARVGDYMPWRWKQLVEKSTAGKEEGTVYLAPINPVIPDDYVSLIKKRYEEMKEYLFEPFTVEGHDPDGKEPIRDQDGNVRIGFGERADRNALWSMDWLVEYIEEPLPK
ncbi:MAG: BMP family ABC transporter substrate-binding protein [Nitrososphaerota archaeon]